MKSADSNRLVTAMSLYGLLATAAFFTLTGDIRIVVLILFAGLAVKTWVVFEREKMDLESESSDESE